MAPAELAQPDLRLRFRDCITLSNPLANWLEKMTAPTLADRFDTARVALAALAPLSSDALALPLSSLENQRLQIDTHPEQLQVRIHPVWSAPLPRLQDLASMALLTLLGPLALVILALFPLGMVYTRQAFTAGDIGGISVGLLLLCFGVVPWVTGLNWIKGHLTGILIEGFDHRLTIKYQLFGWTYWQQIKPTVDITSIYPLPLNKEEKTVMISFKGSSPLQLANKLMTQESQVLIETLQHWCDRYG